MLKKVVIDCDPGIDDTYALLLSIPYLDVIGITAVGGNVPLKYTSKNALYVTELIGREDIPVYAGYDGPMFTKLETASEVHGKGGLGDVEITEPRRSLKNEHAVDFLIDTFMNRDDTMLAAIGPLTNVAQALLKEPALKERIPELLIMGGNVTAGNFSPAAEFNIAVDPEAAKIVFESGIPIKMVGLNLTRQCVITKEDEEQLRKIGTKPAIFAANLLNFSLRTPVNSKKKIPASNMCDAATLAWLVKPELFKSIPMHVDVETKGEFTRGMTVCDCRHLMGSDPLQDISHVDVGEPREDNNVDVAVEFDLAGFKELLFDTFASYKDV